MMLLFLGSVVSQTQVDTIYGTVEGIRDNHDGRDFDKFIAIPFSEPPVGDLRWRKPQRPAAWDDVYVATEDKDLPVMVWIHGGAFFFESHWSYHPEVLIMHGDVIYVGINYRLGSLGFLSSGMTTPPLVTMGCGIRLPLSFGQSAGGSSVSHMLMSPHSNQFITGGIALSGASSANFGAVDLVNAVQGVKMLNHVFGCDRDENYFAGIIDCLRLEDAETLDFWSILGFLIYHQQLPPYLPVIDGDFIADVSLWSGV